jgi:hypothetical protein
MAVLLASALFLLATAACVERLVRARRAWTALIALPPLIAAWVVLWLTRLPPTAEHALLAFALADLAVLAISIVAVLRMLAGIGPDAFSEDADDDGDGGCDHAPRVPPRTPPGRAPRHARRIWPREGPRRPSDRRVLRRSRSARHDVAPRDR